MSDTGSATPEPKDPLDIPAEEGPIGKPSQAEGEDGAAPEQTTPAETGKPSQAEGDSGDFDDAH